jgi:hypothetical protein
VARDADVGAISTQLDTVTQLLMQSIKENQAFNAEMLQHATARGGGTAGKVPTGGRLAGDSWQVTQAQEEPRFAEDGVRQNQRQEEEGKKAFLWFGVLTGQTGSLHRSEAEARKQAREFTPRGRRSAAFTTKEAAQDWVAQNLDDPHSSDTEGDTTEDSSTVEPPEAAPSRARAMSNVVPPPPVEATVSSSSLGTSRSVRRMRYLELE